MLVRVSLHTFMPLLKLIVIGSELDRRVGDADFYRVFIERVVLWAPQVRVILQLTFQYVQGRVGDNLCWLSLCSLHGLRLGLDF